MENNESKNLARDYPDFMGINPAMLSIRMSLKNSFLIPCSTCGSIMTRLPFEVVDNTGMPICIIFSYNQYLNSDGESGLSS